MIGYICTPTVLILDCRAWQCHRPMDVTPRVRNLLGTSNSMPRGSISSPSSTPLLAPSGGKHSLAGRGRRADLRCPRRGRRNWLGGLSLFADLARLRGFPGRRGAFERLSEPWTLLRQTHPRATMARWSRSLACQSRRGRRAVHLGCDRAALSLTVSAIGPRRPFSAMSACLRRTRPCANDALMGLVQSADKSHDFI